MGSIASGVSNVIGDVAGGAGNILGSFGGITNNMAKGFTPQNEYSATSPVDVGSLNDAMNQAQAGFVQNQGSQNQLAQALLAQSRGAGPNPAQAMLNQATQNNAIQGAGMIASQKGINPALAQRQIADQTAHLNQQAAGQSAIMNSQQQLAAQNQLGGLYNNMAGQNLQRLGYSGQLANQGGLGSQGINAGTSAQNAAANQATAGGILGGIGSALQGPMSSMMAHGGEVPGYASGGTVFGGAGGVSGSKAFSVDTGASESIANQILSQSGVPMWANSGKSIGNAFNSMGKTIGGGGAGGGAADALPGSEAPAVGGLADLGPELMVAAHGAMVPHYDSGGIIGKAMQLAPLALALLAHGGMVHAKVSPGEKIQDPSGQMKKVPGKAKVKGDSTKNDNVDAMLKPGAIVVPRSKANDKEKTKEFIQHIKKQKGQNDGGGYGRVLEAHRKLGESLKAMKGKAS